MAYEGPVGLPGEPETDREVYAAFPVLGHEDFTAFLHRDILAYLGRVKPTPEGDHLFFVEGFGRLRFRLVDGTGAG